MFFNNEERKVKIIDIFINEPKGYLFIIYTMSMRIYGG